MIKDDSLLTILNSEMKSRYLDGEKEILLTALNLCTCLQHSPMPDWVADAVNEALYSWEQVQVKTLDEAFQVTRPKFFHLNKHKNKPIIRSKINAAVFRAKRRGKAVDDGLFDDIGVDLNISGAKAKQYYYEKF